jgi:hypothetical protein
MTGGPQLLQVRAPDGLPGCTLTFTATGLPPGLELSPCGLISGLLSQAGSYDPVISVFDASGSVSQGSVSKGSVLASVPFRWQVHQPADTGPPGPIQLNHSRLCAVPGASVVVAGCDGRPTERWQVFGGPLAVEILSPQVGLCLAVPGDQVLSPSLALGACTTTDPGATWRLP